MKKFDSYLNFRWVPCYAEGDTPADPAPKPADPTPAPKADDELAKYKQSNEALAAELEAIRRNASLSKDDRERMKKVLDDERNRFKTQEQLLSDQISQTQTDYEEKLKSERERAEKYQSRYINSIRQSALTSAAAANDAYNPETLLAVVQTWTEVKPEITDTGEETGNYNVIVNLPSQDAEGKPITLALDPSKAIQKMKEDPKYANLFKSDHASGWGQSASRKDTPVTRADLSDHARFLELKKQGKI